MDGRKQGKEEEKKRGREKESKRKERKSKEEDKRGTGSLTQRWMRGRRVIQEKGSRHNGGMLWQKMNTKKEYEEET